MTSSTFLKHVNKETYFKNIFSQEAHLARNKPTFKLAFLILVNEVDSFPNVKQSIEILDDGAAIFLLQIDEKAASFEENVDFQKWKIDKPNVHVSTKKFDARWGHSSLTFLQLSGFLEVVI